MTMTLKSRFLRPRKHATPLHFIWVPILILSVVQWRLHNSASFRRLSSQYHHASPDEDAPLYHHHHHQQQQPLARITTNSSNKTVSASVAVQGEQQHQDDRPFVTRTLDIDPREARGFRSIHRPQNSKWKDVKYKKLTITNNKRNTNSSNNTFLFGASEVVANNTTKSSSRPTPLQKSSLPLYISNNDNTNITASKNKSRGTPTDLAAETTLLIRPKHFQVKSTKNTSTTASIRSNGTKTSFRSSRVIMTPTTVTTTTSVGGGHDAVMMVRAHHDNQTKQTTSRHTQELQALKRKHSILLAQSTTGSTAMSPNYNDNRTMEEHPDNDTSSSTTAVTMKKKQKFEESSSSHTKLFNYSRPAIPNPKTTLPSPKISTNSSMVILVLSSRTRFEHRQAIRESWGQGHDNIFFVVGGPPVCNRNCDGAIDTTNTGDGDQTGSRNNDSGTDKSRISWSLETGTTETISSEQLQILRQQEEQQYQERQQMLLWEEQQRYHDLIDTIHPESYRSLPYKLQSAFWFVIDNLQHVDWLVKLDDDVVARPNLLQAWMLHHQKKQQQQHSSRPHSSPNSTTYAYGMPIGQPVLDPNTPTIIGKLALHTPVQRWGKWAEDPHFYSKPIYPIWPHGSAGYVVSRPVAEYVATSKLHYYQGEDSGLGIWMAQASSFSSSSSSSSSSSFFETSHRNVSKTMESNIRGVNWFHSKAFHKGGKCDITKLVIGHKMSPNVIRKCFDTVGDDSNSNSSSSSSSSSSSNSNNNSTTKNRNNIAFPLEQLLLKQH